ncbi:HTH domain protein [Tritonibacter multivorans]|uniref:HTH domain protein n=1 Tax=Tritonibacter multivorans TaxID=928856 RepID=A0A0P1GDM8_9RHOB|nr:YafY family protein [Tritonibacter multivorans]MDA7420180.1 YafY family protein [Tritonibacter multivorans]CUH79843.1 HTH domain protein [Tritonibacter multivorans]SFC01263.1 Predicted DNA-binding transcriptional regulator YafY, contains an HTH and WYL domains [Tritonibacter multivorans]
MAKTARLFRLMQLLRLGTPPITAQVLAADLGVSVRTLHRDIDELRKLGAVIDGEAGFGFTLIEDATLPPLGFTATELEALVLGLREVQETADPELATAAQKALGKLESRLPESQAHRLRHAVLNAHRFDRPAVPNVDPATLRTACWDEREITFDYVDGAGKGSTRRVKPLSLFYFDRSTVLVAWCYLRQDFRVFRLDRMDVLTVSDQSFRPDRVPLLRAAMAQFRKTASQ